MRRTGLIGGHLIAAFGLALAGCGGDSPAGPAAGGSDSGNNAGTGTGTLAVTARITAQDVSGGFVTDFTVTLRDANQNPVSGARVEVLNDALGAVTLLEIDAGSGEYRASLNTFAPGDYGLTVVRGPDRVEGVVVGGLSDHSILSPLVGAKVTAYQPLTVTWDPTGAMHATVATRDFMATDMADAGSYTIAAENNPPRALQRVRVWRSNDVEIAGGLEGSLLSLVVRNTVDPITVQE